MNEQFREQYNRSCKDTLILLCKYVWINLSQFFECDQQFQEYKITPYSINTLNDDNTLLTTKQSKRQHFDLQIQDHMLIQHDQISRFKQLATLKWWKQLICCQSEQNNQFELETQIDLSEEKVFQEDKQQKQFSNNGKKSSHPQQKGTQNNDIVQFDPQFFENDKPNIMSALSQLNNDSLVQLKPVQQKVNQFGNVKRKKRQIISASQQSIINNQTKFKQNNTSLKKQYQEISAQKSSDIVYQQQNTSVYHAKSRIIISKQQPKINAKDDFDRLDSNLKYNENKKNQKQLQKKKINQKNSYSNVNQCKNLQSLIKIDQSKIITSNNNICQNKSQTQHLFQTSQNIGDSMGKKKRKAKNIFSQQAIQDTNIEAIQQQPPADYTEKKRRTRRRHNNIINQQKDQQNRANKRKQQRQRQQLEVIIFSDNQQN